MRTKVTILNFITDALPQVIIFILGIFKIKIFIDLLGQEELGLYQLYGQIIAYLVLIEGGVGSALLFRLYKPLAKKDNEKVNEIMSAAKVIFNIIGIIILAVGLILSFNISFFVKGNPFSDSYMQLVFILFLISQAVYYFSIPYRTLFEAEQKRYIPNIIFQTITILKSIVEILIILLGHGLLMIVTSLIICSLVANGLIYILCRKKHKYLTFKGKKDFTMLKDVKHLFVNTLGNLLTNNIDVIIISKILGLKFVAIYTTYNYFIEALKQFVDKITGATMSSVGDLMVTNKKKAGEIFNEFNCFVFFLASIIVVPVFLCINQFIDIWYDGKIFTSLVLSLLFSIILFYQVIRIPLKVFILSSGKFKETKNFVILEIIINLTLSLILVNYMGISGVLIATIISLFIADFLTKPFVICKQVLDIKAKDYYKKSILNMIFISVVTIVAYLIFPKYYDNVFICIIFGLLIAILNGIIVTIYYYVTNQFKFIERFKIFKKNK